MNTNDSCPLDGVQVLDLSSGPAGGLATMILADFGARVIHQVDPVYDYLNQEPSAPMWLRGKARVDAADLPTTRGQPDTSVPTQAIAEADVLVISRPSSFPELTYAYCAAINPRLIYCEITAAGVDSALPPYEGVIAAHAGRMQSMSGIIPGAGPHYAAVPVATHATAQNTASAVLAGLYRRRRDGRGSHLRTSLLQGLMPYDMAGSLSLQLRPDTGRVDPARMMPTLNYHPVQCADGKWLQLGNLLPHLFESFLRCIGLEDCLALLPEQTEAVRDRILEVMQSRTRDEWMSRFVADGGIAAHPYLTAEELLSDPDMTMNGHVVELDGVRQLGPLARLTRTPARITAAAKSRSAVVASASPAGGPAGARASADPAPAGAHTTLPLSGVTVLELATIIAAPLGASFLADLGARVIKVEAIGGDPFRNMLGGLGAVRCNQGKASISVDLKTPEGRDIVHQLATRADILIHNYRPGVPERLGIGYADLAVLNPRLVYVSANGYGPSGPGARRPSTHPIPGAAMGGAEYQAGGTIERLLSVPELREAARRLMRANEVNPDPNTAVVICTASLLGLVARDTCGFGQQIFVDMFIANAYANFDDLVVYPGKPRRPPLGDGLRGPHPLYRLYPCLQGWVFLGLKHKREWRAFCELTGRAGSASEDPFAPVGSAGQALLAAELTELFSTRSAEQWAVLCADTGIGCVQADAHNLAEFFFGHCQQGSTLMAKVRHPSLGDYFRHAPMIDLPGVPASPAPAVEAGADGRALLGELGFPAESIDTLFERGILWRA
ncbi:MAG: CoA transferase [Pseudomonadales bacterium]